MAVSTINQINESINQLNYCLKHLGSSVYPDEHYMCMDENKLSQLVTSAYTYKLINKYTTRDLK